MISVSSTRKCRFFFLQNLPQGKLCGVVWMQPKTCVGVSGRDMPGFAMGVIKISRNVQSISIASYLWKVQLFSTSKVDHVFYVMC